jgi:hypothetical protein
MERFRHIIVDGTGVPLPYTSTAGGGGHVEYAHPPRDRVPHAEQLASQIDAAAEAARVRVNSVGPGIIVEGLSLECVSSLGDQLEVQKLDDRNSSIELLSTRAEGDKTFATVFIPEGKLKNFLAKIDRYKTQNSQQRRDGGPKNKELVESIESIQLPVVRSFWTDTPDLFPTSLDEKVWLEVWVRTTSTNADSEPLESLRSECARVGIDLDERVVRFPERAVMIAFGSLREWGASLSLLGDIAELRRAKVVPTDFIEMPPRDVAEFVEDAAKRIDAPPEAAPAVCLLDTGLNGEHPLLKPAVTAKDIQTVNPAWTSADEQGHGTEMAGLAVFGDGLPEHLAQNGRLELRHRLESVKLIRTGVDHDPENYGSVTTEGLALAEVAAPDRQRVACLAITADDRDKGAPSLWSGAIDQHASGGLDDRQRLYVVAAGNIRDNPFLAPQYPELNRRERGIEDPAQAWNALTVGAYTDRSLITSPEFKNHSPVAPRGALCPTSRTSLMWPDDGWPLKPDVVMEGGNYAAEPNGEVLPCDDLRLLTTTVKPTGRLLETMADTSAATAQVARMAARLMAAYPELWPETVRALILHSAAWNERMLAEFPEGPKANARSRLCCYGYGVPNEERAFWTVHNAVTLIAQESLTPFRKVDSTYKTRDCHVHELPWPKDVLESLGNQEVTVRITLSYFIEPSPGRRGWTRKFRYASHGLRFAIRGPLESDADFRKRITKTEWSEGEITKAETRPDTAEPQNWAVGYNNRSRGSIHSDWWTAPAVEVARSGKIAVYPVTGWWRERAHLGRYDRATRYSLIVTISTPEVTTDLLTPIRPVVKVPAKPR